MKQINVLLLGGWQESAPIILKHFKNHKRYRFFVGDRWKYSAARFSRFCKGFCLLPNFEEDENLYVKELIEYCRSQKIDVVLPIPHDEMILVSRHKDYLISEGVNILVPDYKLLDLVVDKYKLGEHFDANGIPYPRTYCMGVHKAEEIVGKEKFPMIIKIRGGTGQHFQRITYSKEDFLDHIKMVTGKVGKENLIAQKFIPGLETESMYTVGALCDTKGDLKTIVPTKKIRARPYTGGSGVCVRTEKDKEIIALCEKVVYSLRGWVGILNIEVKRDVETGKLYVIEINPRPWGTPMYAMLLAGVNIIELWIKATLGEVIEKQMDFREGCHSVEIINDYLLLTDLIRDLFSKNRSGALKTLRSYKYPYIIRDSQSSLHSNLDLNLTDPFPFLFKIFRIRKKLFYSIIPFHNK